MDDMIIRQGTREDINDIAKLEKICFKDPWSEESIREEIEENGLALYIVAEIEGKVIGYGGMWWILDEGHITNVAVHPDKRGLNIGRTMVLTMLNFARKQGIEKFTLEVRMSNEPAKRLYENIGFKGVGVRPHYYKDGEDALIMWTQEERDEK